MGSSSQNTRSASMPKSASIITRARFVTRMEATGATSPIAECLGIFIAKARKIIQRGMSVEKPKEKKEEKRKQLHIELKGDIRAIVDEYCLESGTDIHTVAFSMGFLSGRTGDEQISMQHLMHLLQAYFFAGIFYSRTREFNYGYLTAEDRKKKTDKMVEDFKREQEQKIVGQTAPEEKKQKLNKPSYVG
jgi:hypothetical protein